MTASSGTTTRGQGQRGHSPVREVLVVELLGGFGDVLLALPAVHALARSHPGASVRVLTFPPGDVLLREDPSVAEVVTTGDHRPGAPRRAVAAELARRRYDLVVTTTTYDGIADVCAAAAPRAVTDLWRRPPVDERVDRRFLRLLAEAGAIAPEHADTPLRVVLTDAERADGEQELDTLVPPGAVPVVLVPGAGMPVKRWPSPRWEQLAAECAAQGHPVLQVGLDAPSVRGSVAVPAGDLRALAAFLAAVGGRGGVVVGGDTGPVRLATAVGARAVGLYGPTVAGRYGLDPALATDLQGLPDCPVRLPAAFPEQECWWSARCPLSRDGSGDPECMADLSVAAVAEAVGRELDRSRPVATPSGSWVRAAPRSS